MTAPISTRPTLFSYPTLNLETIDAQLITARRTALVAAVYFLATASTPMACALLLSAVALDCALHVVTQSRQQVNDLRGDLQGAHQLNHYLRIELDETTRALNVYKYAEQREPYESYMKDQCQAPLNGSFLHDISQIFA